MRFSFIAAEKATYPVAWLCHQLRVSTSGFYARRERPTCVRLRDDERLAADIAAVPAESGAPYGSRRVLHQLRRKGRRTSRDRVARLMRAQGLFGRKHRRFRVTTDSKHDEPIAPNLLQRDFTAEAPGMTMVRDTTAIETRQGWL